MLSNQVKFIQAIIRKELVVSGRKKMDLIRDLKTKGFKAFPKVIKPTTEIVSEEPAEGEEEEAEVDDPATNGYDYLLHVILFAVFISDYRCKSTPLQPRESPNCK